MKTKTLLLFFVFAAVSLQAQVSKTVDCTAGALATLLTSTEKATVTNLTLTGTIDSRDFPTMRNMPLLAVIDMSTVTIAAYSSNGAAAIPENAFYFNSRFTSITLPNSITSIGNSAFYSCSGLSSVTIPNSVTVIGFGAFRECSKLSSVTIPSSVTAIGSLAFLSCSALITVDNANNNYSSNDGVLFNKNQTLLISCPNSKNSSYVIPNSVTSIGKHAFYGCSGLTSVTIPNLVTSIDSSAFSNCSGLSSVTIPNSVTSIGVSAFWGCNGLTSASISNSVTSIGSNAFSDCIGLTTINIPSSVTSIGTAAFSGCSGLTTINIPSSVTSIGTAAFSGCRGLTSVSIPNSVTTIEYCAFEGCSGLSSVTIPSSVTSIGSLAFYCGAFITVDNANTNYSSNDGVLFNKNQTLLISCPFSKNGSYVIPNSVTSIGKHAFYGCSGLTSVTIPNSVTSIDSSAFYGCSKLSSVTIPNSVTTIGSKAFTNCSGLTSVTIPNSVTTIKSYAFWFCSGLTSVSIPNSVTTIEYSAFDGCSGLTKITTFAKIPISIYRNVFSDVNKTTCTLYVPAGSKALYQAATGWKDFVNIVEMTDASVQLQALANVKICPNPVVESFKISGLIGSAEITIINTNGQMVLRQNVFENQPIATGSLQKGAYFVKAQNNKGTTVIKFLKK